MGDKKNNKNEEENIKGCEYLEFDVDMETSEELRVHDEFIPNLNHWTTSHEQKVKAEEIEKVTNNSNSQLKN